MTLLTLSLLAVVVVPLSLWAVRRCFGPDAARISLVGMLLLVPLSAFAGESPPAPDLKTALTEGLIKYVIPVGLTALTGVLVAAFAALRTYLLSLASRHDATANAIASAHAGAQVADTVAAIVQYVETNVRPAYARVAADGKLTPEEAEDLRAEALRLLKEALGQQGPELAEQLLGIAKPMFDAWLAALLEKAASKLPPSVKLPGGEVPVPTEKPVLSAIPSPNPS